MLMAHSSFVQPVRLCAHHVRRSYFVFIIYYFVFAFSTCQLQSATVAIFEPFVANYPVLFALLSFNLRVLCTVPVCSRTLASFFLLSQKHAPYASGICLVKRVAHCVPHGQANYPPLLYAVWSLCSRSQTLVPRLGKCKSLNTLKVAGLMRYCCAVRRERTLMLFAFPKGVQPVRLRRVVHERRPPKRLAFT